LQERHRSGAARFQLSGSAFGSHKPNHAIAQIKYPLFMRDSITLTDSASPLLRPKSDATGFAMRRQPSEAADADSQLADSLLNALPLLPDDKAEASSIHVNILPNLSANPFGGPSWLSAFHLCCLGFPGPAALPRPYESKSANFHQGLSPGQKTNPLCAHEQLSTLEMCLVSTLQRVPPELTA